jgi:predicted Zn-dependent peptidase
VIFHETRLDNGLQIVGEESPHAHSVALGFFVRTGARDETDAISGVSHFLEHMVFKGTDRHSPEDVNRVFDEVGAKYNASTGEETTLFYAAVLPEYLAQTCDLLADILRPALRDDDFTMEKKVILEEIGMYDDQPTFVVFERIMQMHFAGHPLGRSILGTNESVTALTGDQMRAYHRDRYLAGNITLAVAGKFDWDEVVALAKQYCGHWPAGSCSRATPPAKPPGGMEVITKATSQQQHVMQMAPAPSAQDPLRYAAELLTVIVGDETGSRIFWQLVDPGHVETAELGYNEFDGTGSYLAHLSCTPDETAANVRRMQAIYDDINAHGVTEQELSQAKNKVSSRIVLRSERPMGRLASLGHNWIARHEYRTVDDDLATLRSITTADIRRLLDAYPLRPVTQATVGPLKSL